MAPTDPDHTIAALRAALDASPDNHALRRHLAETLLGFGRHAEAEAEWKQVLQQRPQDEDAMLGLARTFRVQGKTSPAHVVLEQLVARGVLRARVERAWLLLAEGDVPGAVRDYKAALFDDPGLRDRELGERLGVSAAHEADASIVDGRERVEAGDGEIRRTPELERPAITFAQVGGMHDLKQEIRRKILLPLQKPELFQAYGKKAGGGILMYGPPGCGKTFLARATAGEVGARFLSIGIHDVLDMWVGQSERNLHDVFDHARNNRPCVLFFDEVDALGASRSDLKTSAGRHTINQFLSELDGVQHGNEGILVLAATNAPWHMDAAFQRPGRFDRVLFVPPPDATARAEILRLCLQGRPQSVIDHEQIAKKTDGFSGADLAAVVDGAVESKLDDAMASGEVVPLTTKDLLAVVKQRRPTTKEWFAAARNYVLYANEGGKYDDLKRYLKL